MPSSSDYQIAVYYFPNYHPDPRNAQVHGPGWTEWELVKSARERFSGHRQPRTPQWGYQDESDPQVMAQKIAAAAGHSVDAFIFDWYWYNDGPFLERGLEQGFLNAPNNHLIKFAVMWANHNWTDIHPARLRECRSGSNPLLYSGTVTRQTFESAARHCIEHYFNHPAYWKINGAPYFSLYDLPQLIGSLGGFNETRDALAWFRAETQAAGFPNLHLNQVFWNRTILPGEQTLRHPNHLLQGLGFDSITSYVWVHHAVLDPFPAATYASVEKQYLQFWEQVDQEIDLPYFPNATVGWDSSPRTVQSDSFENAGYPFTPCLNDSSPQQFKTALQKIKTRMDENSASQGHPRILTINSWNEWTEGSYLEPGAHFGMGYLEALKDVFGSLAGR